MKRCFAFLLIFLLASFFCSAEYIALKNGKVYKVDGTYKIQDKVIIFKMKGSGVEISISLDKVDLERTKKLNEKPKPKPKKTSSKVITNKDLDELGPRSRTETTVEATEEGEQKIQRSEVWYIPDYSTGALSEKDVEWWKAEVTKVQQRLLEVYELHTAEISTYNDMVVDANSQKDAAIKKQKIDGLGVQVEKVKELEDLLRDWYQAMRQLYATGRDLEIEDWIIAPLDATIEANKKLGE